MLTSIHIQDFKGFKDTKIDTLKRVNLVVGGQNVGKTSLLEGVRWGSLQLENDSLSEKEKSVQSPNSMRTQEHDYAEEDVFAGASIELKGYIFNPDIGSPSVVSCFLPTQDSLAQKFSQLKPKERQKLLGLLKKIDVRLENIEVTAPKGMAYLQVTLDGLNNYLKLHELGHGFSRLLTIYSELLASKSDLALIDEIENGIHYSALPTVFEGIKNIAQMNAAQLIITTHSKECIRAASDAFKDSPDDFQVIRLVRKDDNVVAHIIPADYVAASLEMRGELR